MEYSDAPVHIKYAKKESIIRLILFLLTAIAFCLLEFSKIQNYCNEAGYRFSAIEYVYLITACGANLPYTSIAFLLLLDNSFQSYLHVSTNKMIEQVFKSIRAGLFAALSIVVFALIPAVFVGTWSIEWTEPSLISKGHLTDSIITRMVYTNISPLGGLLISTIILMFFWSSMGSVLITCRKAGLFLLGITLVLYLLFWNSIYLPNSSSFIPNWFFSLNAVVKHTNDKAFFAELLKAIALNVGIIIISVICNAAREHYCHIYLKREVDTL